MASLGEMDCGRLKGLAANKGKNNGKAIILFFHNPTILIHTLGVS